MAWGDPGGPSDSDMGSGNFGGGSSRSSSQSTNADGRDTPGAPDAADGKRGATMGRDGGRAGGGGNSSGSASSSNGSSGLGSDTGVSQSAIDSANSVAAPSRMGSTMTGAGAMVSMEDAADDAQRSFMDRADLQESPDAGFSARADLQAMPQAERESRAMQSISENASPGLLGRIGSFVASMANPVAGLAVNTGARALDAQQAAEAHNAEFGTNLDTSFGTHAMNQAKGTVAGAVGGKIGGQAGASIGASAGPAGAVFGGLLGAATASNGLRDAAMSPNNPSAPSPQSVGDGGGNSSGGLIASNTPAQQPAQPANQPSGYAPIDNSYGNDRGNAFDRYSDYAINFFG